MTADPQTVDVTEPPSIGKEFFSQQFPIIAAVLALGFAGAGGIFGSWCAAKTQRFVPEHFLKAMLGGITAIAGTLYVIDFFFTLPFRI